MRRIPQTCMARFVKWIICTLFILISISTGDDSPHTAYDETGNEVTSSRLVLAPDRPECAKATTLTFCLDDARYPSDEIQREISTNYGTFYKMYAEVSNQTTSSLVDGVGVDEEATYDYAFYYGDKMNLPTKTSTRNSPAYKSYAYKNDYFKDGGYICPAFINYGSIYQAMNARGEWQYIVNLKPWTQTVRLEQCFYPQAPCSYMSTSFETRCVQKYSFQRLIAFEPQGRGLYTDIFRLPTACSCYIRPPEPQNALPPVLQGDASQSLAYVDSTSSNAVANGFKPIRVHGPPPQASRPDYAQAGSSNSFNRGPPNWSPSNSQDGPRGRTWSADVGTPVSHANDQDSRLVERRRVRPEGLSLSDITSDPDVGPSAFGYMDNGPPRDGPPRDRQGMYQPGRSRYDSPQQQGRGPMYQGDGSQMNPTTYSDGPRGPYYQQGPGSDHGPPGPPMQRNGPSQDGMWNGPPSQGPPISQPPINGQPQGSSSANAPVDFSIQGGSSSHPDFQVRQSSGFYDYNSAHGEMNGP